MHRHQHAVVGTGVLTFSFEVAFKAAGGGLGRCSPATLRANTLPKSEYDVPNDAIYSADSACDEGSNGFAKGLERSA